MQPGNPNPTTVSGWLDQVSEGIDTNAYDQALSTCGSDPAVTGQPDGGTAVTNMCNALLGKANGYSVDLAKDTAAILALIGN